MRILHISDLHFNAKNNIENKFIVENFKRIKEYAIKNEIVNIIISGDVFDNISVNLKYRDLFTDDNLHYFVIPGNHDNPETLRSFFSTFDNVTYFQKKPYEKVLIGNVAIYGIPYNNDIKPVDLFSKISHDILTDKTENNLLLLHASPIGINFGMIDVDNNKIKHFPIHFEDLLPLIYIKKKIYIAMGHYHKSFKKWKFDNVLCCMPGSIYPLSAKEKEKRAFSIYDTNEHDAGRVILENMTNLSYKYFFLSPFDINSISQQISESLEKSSSVTKLFINIEGYINQIAKLDKIRNDIDERWGKNHKIPIEWDMNVSVVESLKPEIKSILSKIDKTSKEKTISNEVLTKAKKLIFESYKGISGK